MPNHRSLPLVAALVLLACKPPERGNEKDEAAAKPAVTSEPEAESPAEPPPVTSEPKADPADYSSFGMPTPGPWSNVDYSAAHKALTAIATKDPKLLPREGSPTFAALADLDHLTQLVAELPPGKLLALIFTLGAIQETYGEQLARSPEFEREYLMLGAAVLGVATKLPTAAHSEAEAAALRDDPKQLESVLRYRHGLGKMVEKLTNFESKATLSYAFACEQLARVIEDAAPLMLPDERAAARARLEACAGAGADAKIVERLEGALAEDAPSAPLVTGLLAEHREFAAAQ